MQLKVCCCDVPGCSAKAEVPELHNGALRCPESWCEIRAFPPSTTNMVSAHVCPECWETKLLPILGPGFKREQARLEFLHNLATQNRPAWLSPGQIAQLKHGETVEVDDESPCSS